MTNIEWCDETLNLWAGCTKIRPECANCYAVVMAARLESMNNPHPSFAKYQGISTRADWTGQINLDENAFGAPARWKKPRKVFVNSMSDTFHEEGVPDEWIRKLLRMARTYRDHHYLILTKRPQRMVAFVGQNCSKEAKNLWWGCTAGTQSTLDDSYESMLTLHTLGFQTWVSCEPMLGPVDFTGWEFLDWLIVGGESGPKARPFDLDAAIAVVEWAIAHEVPVFFKQLGDRPVWSGGPVSASLDYDQWPQSWQIRQFPPSMPQ